MKLRMLVVVLALPLLAFDCGGKEPERDPFGLGCKLHVAGAVSEDLWCIMVAHDYSQDEFPQDQWVFEVVAYRGTMEVGAGVGMFLGGRPALNTPYGWNGATRSPLLTDGSAQLYGGSLQAGNYGETHSAESIIDTGALSVTFSAIPPVTATGEQSIGVHGSLTATLPPTAAGANVTLSATF